MLGLTISACAPDNILIPPVTDNETDNTENQSKADVDTQTEQPETDTQPEQTDSPKQEQGVISDTRKENKGVKPTYNIDENEVLTAKTGDLYGKTLTMFVTEEGAFSAGDMNEREWLKGMYDEYGFTVNYAIRSKNTLYSAQAIALKSGMDLGVITSPINDMAASLSLMQSAQRFVKDVKNVPFSQSVFEKTGYKVFTGTGNARMLWYNTDIITDDSPYVLAISDNWTSDVLASHAITAKNNSVKLVESDNWLAFGNTAGEQVTGLTADGFKFAVTSEKSIAAFAKFAEITNLDKDLPEGEYSFDKGNVMFTYTHTPAKADFSVSFAPIPKVSNGAGIAEYCGIGIGIPVSATEENAQIASVFATIWAARYAESRVDELLFDVGLDIEKATKYLEISENSGALVNVDAQISQMFDGDVIDQSLCVDGETAYNTFADGYARAALIKGRY